MRKQAHLAIVILSDEDERSDTHCSNMNTQGTCSLENLDQPQGLLDNVKASFGSNKTVSVHSIVVKDQTCLNYQVAHGGGFKANTYIKLSEMTNGIIGDICQADYGAQLADISSRIKQNIGSVQLDCSPVLDSSHQINIYLNGSLSSVSSHIVGSQLFIDTAINGGTKVDVNYSCAIN